MWRTVGHDRAVNALRRSLEQGRLSHAYLTVGPRHVGKMTLVQDLAQAVNCLNEDERPCGECDQCRRIGRGVHADVQVVGLDSEGAPSGRSRISIGIDQVREVQREASLKPFEGRYRVFIFEHAERLTEEASNSLLKILEEPPDQVLIILLSTDPSVLLPTIVSRCQELKLRPLPRSVVAQELRARYDLEEAKAEELARVSGGRLGWALQAATEPGLQQELAERLESIGGVVLGGLEARLAYAATLAGRFGRDRESASGELEMWLRWWRDLLVLKQGLPELATGSGALQQVADELSSEQVASALRAVQETWGHLERNVNPRLALEDLMLVLPRPGNSVRRDVTGA